jgi:hypothetical protein
MALMAVGGLTFALLTMQARRSHDYREQPNKLVPVVRSVPPAGLAGLGYLPDGTNLVAAVHVAELRATPAGRAFLERAELGGSGLSMADVEKNVGLGREDIDHVVFGVRLLDKQFPRLVLIVQTRQPYDAGRVRSALKAERPIDVGKKKVYQFNLEKPRWNAYLWCAAPTTLVVGTSREDIAAAPDERAAGLEQLPESLQAFIKERLRTGTQAWLAGHAENWDTIRLLAATVLSEENQKVIAAIQTFGFWLRLHDQVEVRGALHCTDAAGAQLVEKALSRALARDNSYLNVLGSSPEARKVADELVKSLQVKQADAWLTLDATAGAETVKQAVNGP